MKLISFIVLSVAFFLYSIVFMICLTFSFIVNRIDAIISSNYKLGDMVDLLVAFIITITAIALLYQPIKTYYKEKPLEQYYDNCVETSAPSECLDKLMVATL